MSPRTLHADALASEQPVFCFTSDIDWAPEWAISETLRFFEDIRTPLTPFLTHESKAIREHFGETEMSLRVGVHPNFLPSSTHGRTPSEVIDQFQVACLLRQF